MRRLTVSMTRRYRPSCDSLRRRPPHCTHVLCHRSAHYRPLETHRGLCDLATTPVEPLAVRRESCPSSTTHPTSHYFFFFNNPAPPEIYPLSLHAALPF